MVEALVKRPKFELVLDPMPLLAEVVDLERRVELGLGDGLHDGRAVKVLLVTTFKILRHLTAISLFFTHALALANLLLKALRINQFQD